MSKAHKIKIRAAVRQIRAKTHCAVCGRQPIDWHSKDHDADHRRRIALMVGNGRSMASILLEISRCRPLCRRCHMLEDGRLAKLSGSRRPIGPPKPCASCGKPYKPLRKGLCNRCNHQQRSSVSAANREEE